MQRDARAILDGALGGTIGTLTMSTAMAAAAELGLMGEHPPELITAQALDAIGKRDREEETQDALALLAHFAFGAGAGALFALLHRRLRLPLAPLVHGLIFGSLVWAVSYKGWVPALGLMPPPEHDRPDRPVSMLLAHWVFGATLGLIVAGVHRRAARVHELSVMAYLLESVEGHAERIGAVKVLAINLVVGERASIIDDALLFAFDLLTPDTVADGAVLNLRRTAMRFHCAGCAGDYHPIGADFRCPRCGTVGQVTDDGSELQIESIEVEYAEAENLEAVT